MWCMKKFIAILFFALACCAGMEEKKENTLLSMASPQSQVTLRGKTPSEVREILGTPTFIRKENPHESWVFKLPDCAVFVFFNKDGTAAFTEAKGICEKNVKIQRTSIKQIVAN